MRVDSCRAKETPTFTVALMSYSHENDTMNKQMDCFIIAIYAAPFAVAKI